jgi:hypothetical protein
MKKKRARKCNGMQGQLVVPLLLDLHQRNGISGMRNWKSGKGGKNRKGGLAAAVDLYWRGKQKEKAQKCDGMQGQLVVSLLLDLHQPNNICGMSNRIPKRNVRTAIKGMPPVLTYEGKGRECGTNADAMQRAARRAAAPDLLQRNKMAGTKKPKSKENFQPGNQSWRQMDVKSRCRPQE